jgi:tetratricopeptide (TPR) repeat protein
MKLSFRVILCVALVGCGGAAVAPPVRKPVDTATMSPDQAAIALAVQARASMDAGDREAAKATMKQASGRLKELTGEEPADALVDVWCTTAPVFFQVGLREEARENLAQAATSTGKIERTQARALALAKLAAAQQAIGQADKALASLKQGEDLAGKEAEPLAQVTMLNGLAVSYHAIGKKSDAERIVQSIASVAQGESVLDLKASYLAWLAATENSIGQRDRAGDTFQKARETAESVKDPMKMVFTMYDVGAKMRRSNFKKSGRELLEDCRSKAMSLPSLATKQSEFQAMYQDIIMLLKD